MYNLKFTLAAEPTDNPRCFNIGIFGDAQRITGFDGDESPRGERLCDALVEGMLDMAKKVNAEIPSDKLLFRGYNTSIPKSYGKVFETNIKVRWSMKTKFIKVSNGDFQRHDYRGVFTGALKILQDYTSKVYNSLKDMEKLQRDKSKSDFSRMCRDIDRLCDEDLLIPSRVFKKDGHIDKEKLSDLLKSAK